MEKQKNPDVFNDLINMECVEKNHIVSTNDGFFAISKSLSEILANKNIFDFPDSDGQRLSCCNFFDDWYLYSINIEDSFTYGLFKLREQEFDAQSGKIADGDTPGVTVSFIAFKAEILMECLKNPTDENRGKLSVEINRVVAFKGQAHHRVLKEYFANPASDGAYLIATLYVKHIATFAKDGYIELPLHYKKIIDQGLSQKASAKQRRIPDFISTLNEKAKRAVCDRERIYIENKECLNEYECKAILATHTGNTSIYSFAAEVEYHARFLVPIFKIKIPLIGHSIYASAIRADMTIDDNEFEGPAPFYKNDSKIVKRQYNLHEGYGFNNFKALTLEKI